MDLHLDRNSIEKNQKFGAISRKTTENLGLKESPDALLGKRLEISGKIPSNIPDYIEPRLKIRF